MISECFMPKCLSSLIQKNRKKRSYRPDSTPVFSCAHVIGQVTEIIQCVAAGGGGWGCRRLCNHVLGKN